MSSTARGFVKGCRALMAPAKAAASKSSSSSAAKPKPRSSSSPKSPSTARKLSAPGGILKVSPVSPALHQFLGAPEASRTDALKKIWAYIKLHNLQNPANKREINCDDKLKAIFEGKDKVGMLEIGKFLSRHFVKTS
ncbi:protein TRI1 [Diospyros lotus]|uniref:protein TRI1 n=1 Tax=Diospyros lotus TaxID=55363 RepID=UPI002252CD0C|nr:protein TRI1 [Diospyros lotus]